MEISAQKLSSKRRSAIARREEEIEQEELEHAEINLTPYLDVVTNLMLMFLTAVSSGIIFSQINTTLPDNAAGAVDDTKKPEDKPEEQPLKLIVTVTRDTLQLFSASELEGTLAAPKLSIGRSGRVGEICDGAYMCESSKCDLGARKCVASNEADAPVFNYRALNAALFEIASRRYNGKPRGAKTYQIRLMADGAIPYSTIVSLMGAMRCKMPDIGKNSDGCMLPTDDPELKKRPEPISTESMVFDTTRAPYDASKMALFSDILFSTGMQ